MVKIGSGVSYSLRNPSYAPALPPANQGIGHLAQARLDNTVARANARHLQALRTDPNFLTFWLRQFCGRTCTCSRPEVDIEAVQIDLAQQTTLVNPDPGLPPIEDGTFRMIRTRAGNGTPLSTLPLNNPLAALVVPPITPLDVDPDNESANADEYLDSLRAEVGADIFPAGDISSGIYSGDKSPCGICLGTGYVQGYTLFNGKRIIFDASGELPLNLHGVDLDTDPSPVVFNLPNNSNCWVQWQVELPTYTYRWLGFTVRNNLLPAANVIIEYSSNLILPVWLPLTLDTLTSSEGTQRFWLIRARRDPNLDFDDGAQFTHIELSYLLSEPPLGQSPNLSYAMDYSAAQAIIRTTFEISAQIPKIPRESLFHDSKYNQLWKVTSVSPKLTSTGQLFGYEIEARMVQRQEAAYVLQSIFHSVTHVQAYRGLEDVQGGQDALLHIEDANDYYNDQEVPAMIGSDTLPGAFVPPTANSPAIENNSDNNPGVFIGGVNNRFLEDDMWGDRVLDLPDGGGGN